MKTAKEIGFYLNDCAIAEITPHYFENHKELEHAILELSDGIGLSGQRPLTWSECVQMMAHLWAVRAAFERDGRMDWETMRAMDVAERFINKRMRDIREAA